MIGFAMASSSFCFSWYSSIEASCEASSHEIASLTEVSSFDLSPASNLLASFSSVRELRKLYAYDSRPFFAVIRAAAASSSAIRTCQRNTLGASEGHYVPLYFSASLTIFSISSFDKRPLSLVIVMRFDLPVVLSAAETFKIPFASISKVTST
jgi:hypothetical protein